jgi:CSLREA domain-containing protein
MMKTRFVSRHYWREVLQITIALAMALLTILILASAPHIAYGGYPYRNAATITVDTLTDEDDGSCSDGDCSLRDAIAVAQAGDTIDFGVTGTITLTVDQLTVDKDLTISGPHANDLTISGDGAYRVFWINESVNATLSKITIADGDGQNGGGIFNRGGVLTVNDCTFVNNSATYDGGAISNRFDGSLHVADSVFDGNTARHGAGIDNREVLTVADSAFTGNVARNWGGGVYNYKGIATVTGSTFTGNGEYTDAGGGICNHEGVLDVMDSTFSANNADGSRGGGGIYNEDRLSVHGSDFLSNTATRGGGITNIGQLTVTTSNFFNNHVVQHGGGILNTEILTVTGSTFYSNTAEWGGGIENTDVLSVSSSTFYSNTVDDTGGGICNHGALTVTNSTFYSNTAGTRGGGINHNEGTLRATNCTFVGNRANDSGGALRNEKTAMLINTIIADSAAGGNCAGSDLEAASTHGLSTDATCSPGFTQTTGISLTLNWQGWVFEVMTDSVAIDAGTNTGCPATDQLGESRPQDGDEDGDAVCDVGAYEFSVMDQKIYLPLVVRQ